MTTFQKVIAWLKNPPVAPSAKVLEEADGFTIENSGKILYNDVKCAVYINIEGSTLRRFPRNYTQELAILLKSGEKMIFEGNHADVVELLNRHFEEFNVRPSFDVPFNTPYYGIYRWRQPNGEYTFVTEEDEDLHNLEKFAYKPVSKKYVWYAVAVFILVVIVGPVLFALSPLLGF